MTLIGWVCIGAIVAVALLSIFFLNFNRDPERRPPEGQVIVAPADGKVLDVIEWPGGEPVNMAKGLMGRVKAITSDLSPQPHYLIPIFMNPFDVHVQRAPLSGRVLKVERRPGGFRMANSLDALENATVEVLLETVIGKVKVLQTAGILVRHIHNWLQPGVDVRIGERFGKIDFGSQVTILLPKAALSQLRVQKGDYVYAGQTVLATYAG
jgi:phosphatidylserine decarboxylase